MRSTLDIWNEEMALIRRRERRDRIADKVNLAANIIGFIAFCIFCVLLPSGAHP